MPYADPAARRRVQREAQRRRRARGVNPSTPRVGLGAAEIGSVLRQEMEDVRRIMPRGDAERVRLIVTLARAMLTAFELSDLAVRLAEVERAVEKFTTEDPCERKSRLYNVA